jgi:hypothetical protein
MVDLARARIADRAVLGQPLPYADGAFDLIVCALAIHYAGNRARRIRGVLPYPAAGRRAGDIHSAPDHGLAAQGRFLFRGAAGD